ncbi:hypothetical protein [Sulfodiicoccus acidiphilus]|uniref:hypothetical protein n=1 Tax=Sulfodiicoccus acidiphilus TaxID=1670455 RepID=UPI000F817540|nr:hypothetical protein [Sulfodiicoccus acidiphilus]
MERPYSDPDVFTLLYNLLSVSGLKVDAVMEGTGYSQVVTRHYRTEREVKGFVYSFFDPEGNLAAAHSLRSEGIRGGPPGTQGVGGPGLLEGLQVLRQVHFGGLPGLHGLLPKSNASVKGGRREAIGG